MKYVFFGTPEFAAIILEKLIKNGFAPEAVICNPDKPIGRKKILTPPPTKIVAQKYNIPAIQSGKIENCKLKIENLKPGVGIVAAYAQIIPQEILFIPKYGFINIHPSLLPRWRGPSPIQSALLNGDEKTGISIILMDEKIDHGPILAAQEWEFPISNFQFSILSQKLAELGAELLIKTLPNFLAGEIKPILQNESEATYSKIIKTGDGFIDLKKLKEAIKNGGQIAAEIERKIRALNPEPGVYTIINEKPPHRCDVINFSDNIQNKINNKKPAHWCGGKRLKILEAELFKRKLKIIKVQPEGKKPINAADFFRGHSDIEIIV